MEKIFFESDFTTKIANFLSLSNIFLDSFQTPQTRESVESSKNRFEYESFEYESRLDPSLKKTEKSGDIHPTHKEKGDLPSSPGPVPWTGPRLCLPPPGPGSKVHVSI